jgi:hypothetical protein
MSDQLGGGDRSVGGQPRTASTPQDPPPAVGEQAAELSQRAGEYLTRGVNEYPLAALVVAAIVGYGVAYLVHSNWNTHGSNWSDEERRDRGRRLAGFERRGTDNPEPIG